MHVMILPLVTRLFLQILWVMPHTHCADCDCFIVLTMIILFAHDPHHCPPFTLTMWEMTTVVVLPLPPLLESVPQFTGQLMVVDVQREQQQSIVDRNDGSIYTIDRIVTTN